MEYLWYVGYGSNLCRERFCHYIEGGEFRLGGNLCKGCKDKTVPEESKPFIIPHCLYFAKSAPRWGDGGVAFISPETELNENKFTYGRMWKITTKQFPEIWDAEGRIGWYKNRIDLGQDADGIPIVTITSDVKFEKTKPSDKYLKTMIIGLKETFQLSDETIFKYLIVKPGIKDNFEKEKLLEIINLDY